MISKDDIDKLQKLHSNVLIAYGGDGTLASKWREAFDAKKAIWPIRNYGMCQKHEELLKALVEDNELKLKDVKFNQTLHQLAEVHYPFEVDGNKKLALNEIQVKSNDITEALRFDVYVNGKKYYDNVIADGAVFAAPNGATGYWKSVTRTIFRDGCGLAFIAPTVGISNLVLKPTDLVKLVLVRDASVALSYDKIKVISDVSKGTEIDMNLSVENLAIIGYEQFMCYDCRKNRNSTILQDQYIV